MNINGSSDSVLAICAIAILAFSFGYGFLSPYLKKKGVSENKILLIVKGSVVVILLAGTYAYQNIS
jgi:ABC-type proline/glycine betaine transport system permease subunit